MTKIIEIGDEVSVRHYHGNQTSTAVVIDLKIDHNNIQRGLLALVQFSDGFTELYPFSKIS